MTASRLSPVARVVVDEIERRGPISFERFMSVVLYSSPHGYYQNHMPGEDSDYQTSPTLTPWFGRLISRWLKHEWEQMGRPEPFTVVEVGPGDASLAAAATEDASAIDGSLRWLFIEPFDRIRAAQRDRMADANVPFDWAASLDEVSVEHGVIVANEVLDNFPVRVFEAGRPPKEVFIDHQLGTFVELLVPIEDPAQLAMCAVPNTLLSEGGRFEINTHMHEWCRKSASALKRGSLLVIDYGDREPEIFTERPSGTVVTYRAGSIGYDPLSDPGTRDITAHVNFSDLEGAASAAGFRDIEVTRQRDFLDRAGLGEVIEGLRRATSEDPALMLSSLAERGVLGLIGATGGLGDLLVLSGRK